MVGRHDQRSEANGIIQKHFGGQVIDLVLFLDPETVKARLVFPRCIGRIVKTASGLGSYPVFRNNGRIDAPGSRSEPSVVPWSTPKFLKRVSAREGFSVAEIR